MSQVVRLGIVSSVDTDTGMIRAVFTDMDNMVSLPMPLLTTGTGWALTNGMPEPGDHVLCIFRGNGLSDGFCLGSLYDGSYDMPADQSQRGIYFEDGSYAYFDKNTGSIEIKAIGNVRIQANQITLDAELIQMNANNIQFDSKSVRINGNLTVVGSIKELNESIGGV